MFAFGFAKSARDNIETADEAILKKAAKLTLAFIETEMDELAASGKLTEVHLATAGRKLVGTYRSGIAAAVHGMVEGFREAGLVDKQTMREFDASCFAPAEPLPPEEIKAIR